MIGWRKQTLMRMRQAWQGYANEMARQTFELRGVSGKEGTRLRGELWMTARRVKGLGGWLGTFGEPEEVLERYPAMKPFVAMGERDGIRRPWKAGARMPRAVEKWLPMVSIWATEREKGASKQVKGYWYSNGSVGYYSAGEEFPTPVVEWMTRGDRR